jgi:PTS system nitrogen regulatory IIA component
MRYKNVPAPRRRSHFFDSSLSPVVRPTWLMYFPQAPFVLGSKAFIGAWRIGRPLMDLVGLIEPSQIIAASRASSKDQLLRDLAARSASRLKLDAHDIYAALKAREALGSTGLGGGFALPHARVEGLDRMFGLFARIGSPVPYDAIDDEPVDLVFLLLIPANAGGEHLAALAAISRQLRERGCAGRLRKAADADELCGILRDLQHS